MKSQKQRFVHFFYKMENEIVNEKQNLEVTLNQYNTNQSQNDTFIKNEIEKQKLRLRQKLDKKSR